MRTWRSADVCVGSSSMWRNQKYCRKRSAAARAVHSFVSLPPYRKNTATPLSDGQRPTGSAGSSTDRFVMETEQILR